MSDSQRWTDADLAKHLARMPKRTVPTIAGDDPIGKLRRNVARSKYGNERFEADGKRFDSKKEARVWLELKARQLAGEIRNLTHHAPLYHLMAPGPDRQIMITVSTYEPDFTYFEGESTVRTVVDAKGHRTAIYALKKRWLFLQDGIVIIEV